MTTKTTMTTMTTMTTVGSDYNDNNNYNDYRDSVSDLDLDRERFSDKVTIVTQLTDKLRNLNHALRGSDL